MNKLRNFLIIFLILIVGLFFVHNPAHSKVYQLLKNGGNPLLQGTMKSTGLDFQSTEGQYAATFTTDVDTAAFLKLAFTALDDDAADTLYGYYNVFTIQNDTTATDTFYGNYISLINSDTDAAGYGIYIEASDSGAGDVSGGLKITNLQSSAINITDAILIDASTDGTITDAIDVSDAEITNAINIGANVLLGTTPTLNFTNFDIASTGHVTVQPGYGIDVNAAGELKVGDTTATTVGIGGTAATTLNVGAAGSLVRAINIGTGTAVDTIKIGTGGTSADNIDIGDTAADVDITGASDIVAGTGDALTLTANAASTWSASTGDLTIEAAISSLNLKGDEAAADAIYLDADEAVGTGITIITGTTAGLAYDGGPFKSATDIDLTLTGAESFDITSAASSAVDVIDIDITSTSAGVVRGIVIDQLTAGTEPVDAAIEIINNDADDAMTAGILFTATQAITTAINASSANVGTALNVGANDIVGTTGLINYTNFNTDANGNITVLAGQGIDTIAAGTLDVGDTTATTIGIGGTAATTLNMGAAGALARAINIGTGTGIDTIIIGGGGTAVDNIDIGDSTADVAITANAGVIDFTNFDVDASGNLEISGQFNSDLYYWVEEFDEEVAAVQLESSLIADFWTTAGTNYAATDVTFLAGCGGTLAANNVDVTDDSSITILGTGNYRINSNPVLEARFKVDNIANCYAVVGFVEGSYTNKTTIDDDICVVGIDSDNGHGFGATEIVLFTNDNAGGDASDDCGVVMANDTYIKVKMDLTDTEQPKVWINGNEVTAGSILGTVQAGITVAPYIMVQNLSGAARTLTIDYIKCWQDRG